MTKPEERRSKVESWYPSAEDIIRTQRQHLLKSRQEAAAFASRKSDATTASWWKRLLHLPA